MSFDNENSVAQNPNEDQRDVAREATPSQDEEGPPSGSAACAPDGLTPEAVEDAQNVDNGNDGDAAGTRREKLKAWEEKASLGALTPADVAEMLEMVGRGHSREEAAPPGKKPKASALRSAASRENGAKSRGPVTAEGKRRSSQNASKFSLRLLGVAEARALNQDLGAAEQLYRELIASFEPASALVQRHFQDLARLYLELEAWERIRDAWVEHRWQQADLERRRLLHEMQAELPGTAQEIFANGLIHCPDSPAKFETMADCLAVVKDHLERRDFDLKDMLQKLYGRGLNPDQARAQMICYRCDDLMKGQALEERWFEVLLKDVAKEEAAARQSCVLLLDGKTMTRAACAARLGPTSEEDVRLMRQGERLRQAIDRKQRVITGVLRMQALADSCKPNSADSTSDEGLGSPQKNPKTNPRSPLESTKVSKKRAKTNPSEPESSPHRVSVKNRPNPSESARSRQAREKRRKRRNRKEPKRGASSE